jgi:hypothetical protein
MRLNCHRNLKALAATFDRFCQNAKLGDSFPSISLKNEKKRNNNFAKYNKNKKKKNKEKQEKKKISSYHKKTLFLM